MVIPLIRKSRKYLLLGAKPPGGAPVYTGKLGGRYYRTEDIRGKGKQSKPSPQFQKHAQGYLHHSVRSGVHGPGQYRISHRDGAYHLHFHSPDWSVTHLKSFKGDPLEAVQHLKGMVRDYQEGTGQRPSRTRTKTPVHQNPDLHPVLNDWAVRHRSDKIEHVSVFDGKGNETATNAGSTKSVSMSRKLLIGKHVIHNHPSGCAGFSIADINTAIQANVRSSTVAAADSVVIINKPAGGWPPVSKEEITAMFRAEKLAAAKEREGLFYRLRNLFRHGMTETELRNEYNMEISNRVVSKLGISQTRRNINDA